MPKAVTSWEQPESAAALPLAPDFPFTEDFPEESRSALPAGWAGLEDWARAARAQVARITPSTLEQVQEWERRPFVRHDHWDKVVLWLVESFDTVGLDLHALFDVVDLTHRYIIAERREHRGGELQKIVMSVMSLMMQVRFSATSLPYTVQQIVQHLCHHQVTVTCIQDMEHKVFAALDGDITRPTSVRLLTLLWVPLAHLGLDEQAWVGLKMPADAPTYLHGPGATRPMAYHFATYALYNILIDSKHYYRRTALESAAGALVCALWQYEAPEEVWNCVIATFRLLVPELTNSELRSVTLSVHKLLEEKVEMRDEQALHATGPVLHPTVETIFQKPQNCAVSLQALRELPIVVDLDTYLPSLHRPVTPRGSAPLAA